MTYIYQQVSKSDFVDAFKKYNRADNFSYDNLCDMFDYFENLAEETDTPMELDVIAICCDYSEWSSLEEYNIQMNTDYESINDIRDDHIVIAENDGTFVTDAH